MNNHKKKLAIILILILISVIGGYLGFKYYKSKQKKAVELPPEKPISAPVTTL